METVLEAPDDFDPNAPFKGEAGKEEPKETTQVEDGQSESTPPDEKASTPPETEEPRDGEEEGERGGAEQGPLIEIDGKQYSLEQVSEWYRDSLNKKEWQKSNTQKAQSVAEARRLLEDALSSDPQLADRYRDVRQRKEGPPPEDPLSKVDEALDVLRKNRPEPFDASYPEWERRKDVLIEERARLRALDAAKSYAGEADAKRYNQELCEAAFETHVTKSQAISDTEYLSMEKWVAEHLRPDETGRYPKNSFDIAFRMLYGDRVERKAAIEKTEQVAKSLERASKAPIRDAGLTTKTKPAAEDEEDNEFFRRVQMRAKGLA